MKKITFTTRHEIEEEFLPRPASENIPDWYVQMQSYGGYGRHGHDVSTGVKKVFEGSGEANATIKKCVPVLDAMTAGYILVTPGDIWVQYPDNENEPIFITRGWFKVSGHQNGQAGKHPNVPTGRDIPKINNPWIIQTPPGYSCLIVPPMHNPNGYFECLPGIVDTDTYVSEINFPFNLKDPKFSGLIPAGTPMVQVIPFKRDPWKMEFGGEKEIAAATSQGRKHMSQIFNVYKRLWWSKKEFK